MKLYLFTLVLISSFFFQSSEGKADSRKNSLSKEALIKRMQKGGMVMYFRHASTEKDYADQVNANVNDGSTQRVLSEKGWHEAVHVGNAIRFYNIPVGKVISSEYFRAWQTAWLAFGEYEKNADLNFLPFADFTDEQMAEMKKLVVPFLSTKPDQGKNTIIVAHDDPFEASTGIYPEPQGVCFILEPQGNRKFEILGQIAPGDWKLK
jgi:phosphohistidine phosphatase SixA